eukprot:1146967-Pelagomonas_calceolata.AAC.5
MDCRLAGKGIKDGVQTGQEQEAEIAGGLCGNAEGCFRTKNGRKRHMQDTSGAETGLDHACAAR